ncbi:MAG: CDP-alcohol phosphatidyltransferase family protein [Desulfosudis oleivorans]|nr:CDP-alcohol phosphatidyltransferase family protein [Desulfosudis oleivorans]
MAGEEYGKLNFEPIRAILAVITVALLFIVDTQIYWTCFILTIIIIWMDGLDGYVARKLNETSKLGAVIDIIGDRIVENLYWIAFLALGWIPLWIPLVVIIRSTLTDGLRSVAMEQGYAAFGSSTMMQSKIGKFLVASNFSRGGYAVFKAIAFALLIAAHVPSAYPYQNVISLIAYASVYITVFFCVVRGLPVIIESKRFFQAK